MTEDIIWFYDCPYCGAGSEIDSLAELWRSGYRCPERGENPEIDSRPRGEPVS